MIKLIKFSVLLLVCSFLLSHTSHASEMIHEIGFRYNNAISTNGLFDLAPNSSGKLLELKYDLSPLGHSTTLAKHFYAEVAGGQYFPSDFLSGNQSFVGEVSPGLQVQAGAVVAKVSQGIAYMPNAGHLNPVEFATHLSLGITDNTTGLGIALERTHFSSGNASGLDFTGLTIGIKF